MVKIENTYCEDCAPYVKICKECKSEFSDNSNYKKCFECRDEERYPCGGILADTGYKICINCFERFKYNKLLNYDSQIYCKWCQDIRIFDVNIKSIDKPKNKKEPKACSDCGITGIMERYTKCMKCHFKG